MARNASGRPPDAVYECRRVLTDRLDRLASGRIRIRIPKDHDPRTHGGALSHFHPGPEVFLPVSGRMRMDFPAERMTVLPGDACVIPRSMPHQEVIACGGDYRTLVLAEQRDGLSYHFSGGVRGQHPRIIERVFCPASQARRIWEYVDDSIAASESRTMPARAAMAGMMAAFLASVLRIVDGEWRPRPREHFKVSRCRELVLERLGDADLTVERLSDQLQCSADYLSHIFHRETGHRLAAYINNQRIAHAKLLLGTTARTMGEIARSCGYSDQGYFSRQFRRVVGRSPTEYRSGMGMA